MLSPLLDQMAASTVVTLNVGGKIFQICLGTLQKYPDSLLSKMFNPDAKMTPSVKDENGNWFIDRNPKLFSSVLDFYRSDIYPSTMSELLKHEFKYWCIYKKKDCTEEQKFAKEFVQCIMDLHFEKSGYEWIKTHILSDFIEEEDGDRFVFFVPLSILGCNYMQWDNSYPTVDEFYNAIVDDTNDITGDLNPGCVHLAQHIVESSLREKWEHEGIFEKEYKELWQRYNDRDLKEDEIKVMWDNIKLFEEYVKKFNIITSDLICKYLQKKLNNDRIKVSWTTVKPCGGVAHRYDSKLILPLWDKLFPDYFKLDGSDGQCNEYAISSKMLFFEIEHDRETGYGYDHNIHAKLTPDSYKNLDQHIHVNKRQKLY